MLSIISYGEKRKQGKITNAIEKNKVFASFRLTKIKKVKEVNCFTSSKFLGLLPV
jgi:hypothetical protein